jgi:hypothetical protein
MLKKTAALAVLAATALLGATPAFADGYRYHAPQKRVVVVHERAPYRAPRPVVVHRYVQRPAVVQRQPTVVYRQSSSHDVLGGLIVGAVLGAVIASQAGY